MTMRLACAAFALLCGMAPLTHAATSANFAIDRNVIASGGSTMGSANFSAASTLGQAAIGDASSASFNLSAGFWPGALITFTFAPQSNVPIATLVTSNTVTIAGVSGTAPILITGGSYSINGGAYTTAAGTVSDGDLVTVQQTSSASYNTTTVATVTIDGVVGAFSVTTTVAPGSADLAVTKTGTASVSPGTNISYSITLGNNGPDAAQSTTLTDTLPAGTTFVSLAQTSGPAFACTTPAVGAGGTVSCSLATFASGSSAAFTLVAQAGSGTAGTTVTNTASASSATTDPNPANGAASAMTTAGASADLAVTQAGPANAAAGTTITYTIVLSNNGPGAAQAATLSDALPAGTTFVSLAQTSGPAFTCTTPAVGAGGAVSCSIASLAAASSVAFTLVARASPGSAGTTIANTASVSSTTPDPNAVNNSATVSTASAASQSFSGPSATGSGTITASFTGGGPTCSYSNAEFIPLTGHSRSPPAGSAPARITFPHGLFDFTTSGCTPGATLAFTIVYPSALPAGTQYWKYGPRPGIPAAQWYVLAATASGSTMTFSITDGALGDDDLAANGTIVDQGGPGVPADGALRQVPTLSEWMQLLLAMLILGLGVTALRGRSLRIGR